MYGAPTTRHYRRTLRAPFLYLGYRRQCHMLPVPGSHEVSFGTAKTPSGIHKSTMPNVIIKARSPGNGSLSLGSGNGIIAGDRLNEGHVAVRFGDNQMRDPSLIIWLDDVDVTNDVNEAIPGSPGVVIALRKNGGTPRLHTERDPWVIVFGEVRVTKCLT